MEWPVINLGKCRMSTQLASTVMEEGSNDATLADRVVEGRESLASNEFVNSDSDAAREGFWRALGDSFI